MLRNPVEIDSINKYMLFPNFYVTEEQLDTFLSLSGKMKTVLKYSYGSEPDLSSPDGKLLANTLEEAREKQFINESWTLKKQYIAYDVFGNSLVSGNSEADAIRALQNKILLESKLVHQKEIATWNWDLKKSYDSIISDGRYLVYKVWDKTSQKYIYFSSREDAMKSIINDKKTSGEIVTKTEAKYFYTYTDKLTNEQFSVVFYNGDIQGAIEQILNKINN